MIITGLLLGAVLGYVLQRSRFCVTGAFRDIYLSRSTRYFTPFLLALAIHPWGSAARPGAGVAAPAAASVAPGAGRAGGWLVGVGCIGAGGGAPGTYTHNSKFVFFCFFL